MNCPVTPKIVPYVDEQLIVSEMHMITNHLNECKSCQAELARTLEVIEGVSAPAPDTLSGNMTNADFLASVMAGIESPSASSHRLKYAMAAGVLLCVSVFAVYQFHFSVASDSAVQEASRFTPRDGGTEGISTHVNILPMVVSSKGIQPISDIRTLSPTDGITFRYSNILDRTVFIMAFAIDASGELHWFYPAYRHEREDPKSIAVAPNTRDIMMPEVVQPENVTEGNLQIVTVASDIAYSVKDIEKKWKNGREKTVKSLFSRNDLTKIWRTTYSE